MVSPLSISDLHSSPEVFPWLPAQQNDLRLSWCNVIFFSAWCLIARNEYAGSQIVQTPVQTHSKEHGWSAADEGRIQQTG